MARQIIDLGTSPNRGDGDPLRTAFDKINDNFAELYAGNFTEPNATGSDLIPDTDATYDLGSSTKQWADLYVKDFIYLNGARIEVTASGALLVNGSTPPEVQDVQGSVFGDDSTTLVDAVNNVINLDGTISGDVVPDANEAYDLGSATHRFRDLYLSGSTLNLGGTTLSIVGGNLQVGGTDIKDVVTAAGVDYSEIQNAPTAVSELTNDAGYVTLAEVTGEITVNPTGDLQGSVFADDSTLLVDGVSGKIVGDIENTSINTSNIISTGDIIIQNGNDIVTLGSEFGATFQLPDKGVSFLGGGVDGGSYNIAFTSGGFGSILTTNHMNILSGDTINIGTANGLAINNTVTVDNTVTAPSFVGDLTGSVFADDSTLLVDGVNGRLIGDIVTTSITNSRDIDIASEDDVAIITSSGDSNHEWFFNSGGYLDFPTNGELHFNGDAGIQFFTPYDPEAGTTANISIRDTGSTAHLTIENEAPNGWLIVQSDTIIIGGSEDTSTISIGQHNINNTTTTNIYGDTVFRNSRSIEFVGSDITFSDGADPVKSPTVDFTNATVTGLKVDSLFTVEENYSSTPTTKFFEIETGAGNNRLLRTGINMSAFAQEFGPEIDLTSYRSSPANGDAGPGLVLRASTGASVNDVIANIGTEVTDVTDGNVTSKISFTTKHNGSSVTPLTITGSTIDFANANVQNFAPGDIYAKNGQYLYVASASDGGTTTNVAFTYDTNINNARQTFYGKTEFANNGQAAIVDFTGATISGVDDLTVGTSLTVSDKTINTPDTSTGGANSSTATALDVTKTLQVLNSADGSDDWWSLADGTEGQIMHFVPGTGAGTDQHKVTIANWRRWDSGAGVAGEWVVEANLDWLPFKLDFDGNRWTGVATAIFTDGAWQTNNPWID